MNKRWKMPFIRTNVIKLNRIKLILTIWINATHTRKYYMVNYNGIRYLHYRSMVHSHLTINLMHLLICKQRSRFAAEKQFCRNQSSTFHCMCFFGCWIWNGYYSVCDIWIGIMSSRQRQRSCSKPVKPNNSLLWIYQGIYFFTAVSVQRFRTK